VLTIVNIIKQYSVLISAIILLFITVLSLTPIPHLPAVPGSDKTHHFIAWSGAIELIQPYVNRYGEWLDLLANSIGLVCGFIVALFSQLIANKLAKK
jgi:hypothetical protein